MTIRLNIFNLNKATSQILVYRDTAEIADDTQLEPIATLPGNASFFEEQSYLFYDVDYHYRVLAVSASGERLMTKDYIRRLGFDLGCGPKELIYGDEDLGIFGIMEYRDADSALSLGLNAVSGVTGAAATGLLKYIRKGIISYVPTVNVSASMNQLAAAGHYHGGSVKPLVLSTEVAARYAIPSPRFISNNRKYSVHVPSIVDHGATVAPTAQKITSDFHTAPALQNEALDLYRLLLRGTMFTSPDRSKVPAGIGNINWASDTRHYSDSFASATQPNIPSVTISSTGAITLTASAMPHTAVQWGVINPVFEYEGFTE